LLDDEKAPAQGNSAPVFDSTTIRTNEDDIMPTRVFVEGTGTYAHHHEGGIPRVVRSVVEEMRTLHDEFDIESAPTVLAGGRLRNATSIMDRRPATTPVAGFVRACGDAVKCFTGSNSIAWNDTDLLILAGVYWGKGFWPSVRKAKESGATIGAVVHDLIPIHYPQLCHPGWIKKFGEWFDQSIEHADFFVGVSQTTIHNVRQYVQSHGIHGRWADDRFDSFTLGANLPKTDCITPVQEAVQSFFAGANDPYLLVSTIEPRKNHTYLLDAFDRVWQESPETKLCIVGKIGWGCDHVVSRIREHPQFGKSLMMFNDLGDADLKFCYRHAKALVFPSIVEGFGLPIIEALNHGLPVLASDTPIHREVGKELCQYFDLDDANSLVAKIRETERTAQHTDQQRTPYPTLTWEESCRDLLTKCLRMAGTVKTDSSSERSASRGSRVAA
jgi:glycosyltransferase involved in cell wall biosynthesis